MRVTILLVSLILSVIATAAAGDPVLIVNPANNQAIDRHWVAKVYLGEIKSWPGGGAVTVYDLPEDSELRGRFSKEILGRSIANMKALWAQFTFSGKAVPPRQLATDEAVKKAVAADKYALGYIDSASVDDSVRALAK
jgi:ABC-type phosphate transport system substrate-binding protein